MNIIIIVDKRLYHVLPNDEQYDHWITVDKRPYHALPNDEHYDHC